MTLRVETTQDIYKVQNDTNKGSEFFKTEHYPSDSFEKSDNQKYSTKTKVGIVIGILSLAAITLGSICWFKGKGNGENKKFLERLKDGWNKLWGKGKPEKQNKPDKPDGNKKDPGDVSKPNNNKSQETEAVKPPNKNPETNDITEKIEKMRAAIRKKYSLEDSFYKDRPFATYAEAASKNYDKIRGCPNGYYTKTGICNKRISSFTSKDTHDVYCISQNGWHYRIAVKNQNNSSEVVDRISLNVYPNEKLIQKLDDYIAKSGLNVEYKTPVTYEGWFRRHDPITMYFKEPIPKNAEQEIAKIVSPYIRKTNEEVLVGRKIADGVYQIKEPTEADALLLIKRAENLGDEKLVEFLKMPDSPFGARLYETSISQNKVILRTSPGIVKSLEKLLDDIEAVVK